MSFLTSPSHVKNTQNLSFYTYLISLNVLIFQFYLFLQDFFFFFNRILVRGIYGPLLFNLFIHNERQRLGRVQRERKDGRKEIRREGGKERRRREKAGGKEGGKEGG